MGVRGALGVMALHAEPDESGKDVFLLNFESRALWRMIRVQVHASKSHRV